MKRKRPVQYTIRDVPARLDWLAAYASPGLAEQLAAWNGRIRDDYDWDLNALP